MGYSRLNTCITICGVMIFALQALCGQSQWKTNNCRRNAPTLDRIMINSCRSYEPDEHIIFHTNERSLRVSGSQLSITVNVTGDSYVSNGWGINSDAIDRMNNESGCSKPLFLDPFDAPYNGVIPAQSNVIAFVRREPNFSGTLTGLCGEEAVFVLFGNYKPGFIRSIFANSCGSKPGCTRNVVVKLGSCEYDIVYEPDRLANTNGAFISKRGRNIQYSTASNCKPSFHRFRKTAVPQMNRTQLTKCANSDVVNAKFSAINGNQFTEWYTDLSKSPVATGPTFRPPLSLFPEALGGKPGSRSIFVRNNTGARPGDPLKLTLTTYPAPLSSSISLFCPSDSVCTSCKGERVKIGVDVSHSAGLGGYPYRTLILSDGIDSFPVIYPNLGTNVVEVSAPHTSKIAYKIVSVENNYGCISTDGFANDMLTVELEEVLTDYLLPIPALCQKDTLYSLPETPQDLRGQWKIDGETVLAIDPGSYATGAHTAYFIPEKKCAKVDSLSFTIEEYTTPVISLPPFDCHQSTYRPDLTPDSTMNGQWKITPPALIDASSGKVTTSELISGLVYTWIYTDSTQCHGSDSASILIPDCQCSLEVTTSNNTCQDNGTPVNPADDIYIIDLQISGKNASNGWSSPGGSVSGDYDSLYTLGPYPIQEGSRTMIIRDQADTTCLRTITIDPPNTCSVSCTLSATVDNINCHDNSTPADPADDWFTFDLSVVAQNHSGKWETSDGSLTGIYDSTYTLGPYPIQEGSRTMIIRDQADTTCLRTITIDPPNTCSVSCTLSAIAGNISCHDNSTPADPADDWFTFDLSVVAQNHSGKWETSDGSLTGIYDSTYTLGPYSIQEGTRTMVIRDQADTTCLRTITIDPPTPCSRGCELSVTVTDIACNDADTPGTGDDGTYTIDLTVSSSKNDGIWETKDREYSGTYSSIYELGPFPRNSGTKVFTILDQADTACQATISVDPASHCNNICQLAASLSDSCSLGPQGDPQIYYFLEVYIPAQHPMFWIYFKDSLQDIISGNGEIPIGPFSLENVGQQLTISYDMDPNCVIRVQLPPPAKCPTPEPQDCDLKIVELIAKSCTRPASITGIQMELQADIRSTQYPVAMYIGDKFIANIPDSGVLNFPFVVSHQSTFRDSLNVTLETEDHCFTKRAIEIFCPEPALFFPNVFTPNGDGINDEWTVQLPVNITFVKGGIYDRWGSRVGGEYIKNDLGNFFRWNGNTGNQKAEPGSYLYHLSWNQINASKSATGQILLIR